MYMSIEQMSLYYKTSIRPIVEYASIIYDNCSKMNEIGLENVQRRAALVCTGAMKRTETSKMINDLQWESLKVRRHKAKLTALFKIKKGLVPNYLQELLPNMITPQERYVFRHVVKRVDLKTRLNCYKSSFFPSTMDLWIKLSDEESNCNNTKEFKTRLTKNSLFITYYEKYPKSFLFPYSQGYYGRILNRIRYGISPLRYHLFTYSITENPMCPNCHDSVESTKHYFLDCDVYKEHRIQLFTKLCEIHSTFARLKTDFLETGNGDYLIMLLLTGSILAGTNNNQIYFAVVQFLRDTKRFIKINL